MKIINTNPHIWVNTEKLKAFNLEIQFLTDNEEDELNPLIKIIVDFYNPRNIFDEIEIDDLVNIELVLFENNTFIKDYKLKFSNMKYNKNGDITYRMIFKNR